MKVILFDIDGTLMTTGGAGRIAMSRAFTETFGRCDRVDGVPFSGRTDRVIARDLFHAHDVEDHADNWTTFQARYLSKLPDALAECVGSLCPGVGPLLERLAAREDAAVGLLTGNLREGARLKLGHYGIAERFAFGGFGDEHYDRNDVAREALAAARRHVGEVDPADVWVIGDTPLDIACGRAIGARVLAVETGFAERAELIAAQPDLMVKDLSEFDEREWFRSRTAAAS